MTKVDRYITALDVYKRQILERIENPLAAMTEERAAYLQQEKETKAGSQVHSALKMTYYEAFSEARKALNSEEKIGSVGENIILQDNFDMKA